MADKNDKFEPIDLKDYNSKRIMHSEMAEEVIDFIELFDRDAVLASEVGKVTESLYASSS